MNVSAAQRTERSSGVGRPKKFTPERIQQIINLVERGKSPAEIAQLIGVSCWLAFSHLLAARDQPAPTAAGERAPGNCGPQGRRWSQARPPQHETTPSLLKHGVEKSSIDDGAHGLPLVEFRIQLAYKGKERTYQMPLTSEMIIHLGLEAELQNLTMGELITRLTAATLEKVSCDEHQAAELAA